MDIREKLRLLDSLPRNRSRLEPEEQANSASEPSEIPSAAVSQHSVGSFSLFKEAYASDYVQGRIRIAAYLEKQVEFLALVSNSVEIAELDLSKALFIDTETTGLSGGAGTCAFLIGVGYFEGQSFQLHQYFMNDFNEEAELFAELNRMVADFELIVSYNGKSYDIPLLNSRNTYLREKSPYSHLQHFDLLHAVRRLWGKRLTDCSLQTAEGAVLGVERSGDIPGYLIPHRYFQYLRDRQFEPMRPILYHNRQDILSMVALCVVILELFERQAGGNLASADIVPVAKILERAGRYADANRLYHGHLEQNSHQKEMLFRMAFNHKKLENWRAAAQAWHDSLKTGRYHPLPYIELAKHYEHRVKDLARAQDLVVTALSEIETLDALGGLERWQDYKADLIYRLERLQKKLGNAAC